jgi:hypothetical protein
MGTKARGARSPSRKAVGGVVAGPRRTEANSEPLALQSVSAIPFQRLIRQIASDFTPSMINTSADNAWPIVSASFIILPKEPANPARALAVLKFFDWAFANGDKIARSLHYLPLPKSTKDRVCGAWKIEIRVFGGRSRLKKTSPCG